MKQINYIVYMFMLLASFAAVGEESNKRSGSVLVEKIKQEETQDYNRFTLLAHEQNYVLPLNYSSGTSYIYNNDTPDNQKIQHLDFKFQFSIKTPVARSLLSQQNVLYLAYTQQSYWQAYNKSAFFRANNYQPEIFLENNVDVHLPYGWNMQLINVGLAHQSNGRGGVLERTWNRVYLDVNLAKDGWLISLKGWGIVRDKSSLKYNKHIKKYLGHGRILIAHNFNNHVVSFLTYNHLETKFKRGTVQLSYSFPIGLKVRGYMQIFNGFGQSLIEYDHRASAFGLGVSFSDWL